MKTIRTTIFASLVASLVAFTFATAKVDVTWENTEEFTDIEVSGMSAKKSAPIVERELTETFVEEAEDYLPEGWAVHFTVTDLDLAGEYEPWRSIQYDDIRFIKDIYPPRLEASWVVKNAAGDVVTEGQEKVTDLDFTFTINRTRLNTDQFTYERQMIEDFVRKVLRDLPRDGA